MRVESRTGAKGKKGAERRERGSAGKGRVEAEDSPVERAKLGRSLKRKA